MHYKFRTRGVCAQVIEFDLDGDVVSNIVFHGGCNGNLQAISRVSDGMTVEQINNVYRGISCGGKGTSCSDQLSMAVLTAFEQQKSEDKK